VGDRGTRTHFVGSHRRLLRVPPPAKGEGRCSLICKDYFGTALNTQPDEESEVQPVPPAEPRD
jgi:hypothetical protein